MEINKKIIIKKQAEKTIEILKKAGVKVARVIMSIGDRMYFKIQELFTSNGDTKLITDGSEHKIKPKKQYSWTIDNKTLAKMKSTSIGKENNKIREEDTAIGR